MQTLLFQPDLCFSPKLYLFKETNLGKIFDAIPWEQLAECLPEENSGPGAPRWFCSKGMFALMFLKAYLDISDEKLIERFNTDWSLQLFLWQIVGRKSANKRQDHYLPNPCLRS